MSVSTSYPTIRTPYPSDYNKSCIYCGEPVKFLYPANPRVHQGLHCTYQEIRYFYACTNKFCTHFEIPINPAPKYSLPFKHYDFSVWKWIGREAKIYHQNANAIRERIQKEFELKISENTIRSIIDELDIYLAGKIDKKTKEILKSQGKIVLCLDGQEPESGGEALWLFVDVISNRVLKIQILKPATHQVLHKIVENILKSYEVELIGIVSDKQNNITTMHDKFYPKIPHQYCQFHFLQNLWNHIEFKDQNLHSAIAYCINKLYIVNVSHTSEVHIPEIGKVNKREYFSGLESDLRKLVKPRNKKFKQLRGVKSWENVEKYSKTLKEVYEIQDPAHRVTKILKKVDLKIIETLEATRKEYHDCQGLFEEFQTIRSCLNSKGLNRLELDEKFKQIFDKIWTNIRLTDKKAKKRDLKTRQPNSRASRHDIEKQWVRLHKSYRRGLFSYFEFPIFERTNSKMEQHFGQEKMLLYKTCGKTKVGPQVRIRGQYILKQLYAGEEEISNILNNLAKAYDREEIKLGLIDLIHRRSSETGMWQNRIIGKQGLLDLYNKKNKKLD